MFEGQRRLNKSQYLLLSLSVLESTSFFFVLGDKSQLQKICNANCWLLMLIKINVIVSMNIKWLISHCPQDYWFFDRCYLFKLRHFRKIKIQLWNIDYWWMFQSANSELLCIIAFFLEWVTKYNINNDTNNITPTTALDCTCFRINRIHTSLDIWTICCFYQQHSLQFVIVLLSLLRLLCTCDMYCMSILPRKKAFPQGSYFSLFCFTRLTRV